MSLVLHALAVIVDSFPSPCFAIAEDFEPSVGERRSALNRGKTKNKKLFSWLAHDEQPTARKQHNNSPSWTSTTVPRGPDMPRISRQMQRRPSSSSSSSSSSFGSIVADMA